MSDVGQLESRLAWIFGSPRCGSTWLLRLLCYPLEPTTTTPTGVVWPPGRVGLRRRLRRPLHPPRPQAVAINEPYLPQHLTPRVPLPRSDPADLSSRAVMTLNERRERDPHYFFSDEYVDTWR